MTCHSNYPDKREGVYIMKFFLALETTRKNVLSNRSHGDTKHFIPHNPEITTQTTLLHDLHGDTGMRGHRTALLIQLTMYICNILKLYKRERNFFAMHDFRVNQGRAMLSALGAFTQKKLHGFTP